MHSLARNFYPPCRFCLFFLAVQSAQPCGRPPAMFGDDLILIACQALSGSK